MPCGAEGAANELPPVVRTLKDIEQGRKNVESVLRSLSEMFSNDAAFPAMSIKRPKLQPAYHRIIKGENNRSVLIFRPRFSKAERLYKALDGVVVGTVLIEQVKEENMLILNAPDKEINTYLEILRSLDVPVRTLECCSGDLADLKVKSVDVDKEKRTEKSLAAGSSMLLLSEKMFVGSRDSKTRSKQMQVVGDKTAILADTTLELQQAKAVVQLSGGNTSVGGGNLDLYGKTTLQGDVTAKGDIKGGDLEVKNMKVKSSFKSPCTSEGMAVPGAPATGKLNAKLKEEELKAENKK